MSKNDEFVADQMADFTAAQKAGDQQGMVQAFANALSESVGSPTDRINQMTAAIRQQKS